MKLSFKFFLTISVALFLLANTNISYIDESKSPFYTVDESIIPYCDGLDYYLYKEISQENIDLIEIEIPKSQNWYKNLVGAFLTGNYINSEFKKKFDSIIKIHFNNSENFTCNFPAKIRISGDWKAHLDISNFLSSFDVELEEGNILGITKFKLFLPNSNGNESEIFVTTLLREFGYLAPRTFYTNVKVNNGESFKFMFQEKITKEFLEFNNFREGPLIETNETFTWNNTGDELYRNLDETIISSKNLEIGRVINQNWANNNSQNFKITIESLEKFNKALLFSKSNKAMIYEYLNSDTTELFKFDAIIWALDAQHMLNNHNRKFYFNKIDENFLPIYYDGDTFFLEKKDFEFEINKEIASAALLLKNDNMIYNLDIKNFQDKLNANGLNLSLLDVNNYLEKFYNNISTISNSLTTGTNSQFIEIKNNLSFITDHNIGFIFYDIESNTTTLCDQKILNCLEVGDQLDSSLFFNNSIIYNEKKYYLLGSSINNLIDINSKNLITNYTDFEFDEGLFLRSFNDAYFKIDKEQRQIDLGITNKDQKFLIYGNNNFQNWNIFLNDLSFQNLEYRQDVNLLTGCLTLYKLNIKNISIKSTNTHCEDAINIISSNGYIDKIEIKYASFDSLDIDFSNISINTIEISNSGNDCIDLSGGEYYIFNSDITNCGDKGFSIGESSFAFIDTSIIKNSIVGIASKDSSTVYSSNVDIINAKVCLKSYTKKQEFGPSINITNNIICDSEIYDIIQTGSVIQENTND